MIRAHDIRQALRFLTVGAIGLGLYTMLGAGLEAIWRNTAASSLAAYALSVPPTYFLQRRFTFRASHHAFWKYVALQAFLCVAAALIAAMLANAHSIPPIVIFLGAGAIVAALSFFLQRAFVFPHADRQH